MEIIKRLQDIILYSAGSNVPNHAPYVFNNHFVVPDVHSKYLIDMYFYCYILWRVNPFNPSGKSPPVKAGLRAISCLDFLKKRH